MNLNKVALNIWQLGLGFFVLILLTSNTYAAQPLGAFINQVLETNPSIQAAKSSVLAAKAREQASGQPLYNPEFTAEVQNAVENTRDIGLSQKIDWTNKRSARLQISAASACTATARLMQLRQQLINEILDALATYQFQQEIVSLTKERTTLLQKLVSLTNKQYTNGDIARIDLDLAKLALSQAIAQQAEAEISANQALQKLRAATGFNNNLWPRIPSILPVLSSQNMDSEQLIANLPSVIALGQEYKTAQARIRLAEKERYPDPTIGVQWGRQYESGDSQKLWGVTFNIPLYVRNPYRAEVDAAGYDASEAYAKRVDLARQVRAEIKSSAERYQILYHSMQQWQQLSGKPLNNGMVLLERLWQSREISTADYIIQVKQRIDSQIAGVELKNQAWGAWVAWLNASGQVDNWLQLKSLSVGE